ncbi:MAG: phosphoglycerate dehydrogenase, partial [Syntrophorhabdaceae bacterium]
MKYRVLISAPYFLPVIGRYRHEFMERDIEIFTVEVNERLEEAELVKVMGDVDGVICGDDRFTEKVLRGAPRLKVISKWGTGIDSIDREAAANLRIRVCNTVNAFTEPVSDSVLGYMLAFARRQPCMTDAMRANRWEKIPGVALQECSLGVIGVGNIGKRVIRKAMAFGMKIFGCDILEIPQDFLQETGVRMVSKDELLSNADFVSLHPDLNMTSHHLISDRDFPLMKRNAVLINTSRGPVVDESALISALYRGIIHGAALDVFEVEPLPADSPLRGFKNVMLAPHNSNSSPMAWEKVHINTMKNLFEGLRIE